MWRVTGDTWWGLNILSKFQLHSSIGLGFMMYWRLGGKRWPTHLMNDEGVYTECWSDLDNYSVKKCSHKSSLFRRESNLKKVSHFWTYVNICGSLGYPPLPKESSYFALLVVLLLKGGGLQGVGQEGGPLVNAAAASINVPGGLMVHKGCRADRQHITDT